MSTNKDCRNAKTAEEYLLQCLFKAEDDRDKAIAYCDEVRAKEDEHKAYIESLGNLPVYYYVRTNAVSGRLHPIIYLTTLVWILSIVLKICLK